ncbi:hypothetical protein FQA39_LY04909 [Lamprigera yunnana]|nr:hypothetical protein FQA39_LY04909 [Lamprigera yunnana]
MENLSPREIKLAKSRFDTDDEEYFVLRNEVAESEDELEIVNEEIFDMAPTDEITETAEIEEESISKSGLKRSTISKPAIRRLMKNIVIIKPGPTQSVQNAITEEAYQKQNVLNGMTYPKE